ncbi:MAG: PQQ-dependent sugar dehydrogenase [Leeuwenhoekiella sp.]
MKRLLPLVFGLIFGSIFAQNIDLQEIASGFSSPLNIQNAGDDRLFVVERGGVIKIVNTDGSVNATSFINISGRVTASGERGLLGLAFHPDYRNNGYFYVYYIDKSNNTQVSRFSVSDSNPDVADPSSEYKILDFSQPFNNHNGGCIAFGPDGYLYISSGDGGSGGDPQDRAQKTTNFWGKFLRIDINNGSPYSIPDTNPFAGQTDKTEEIWAYGLRNVWKFSFDRSTGDLWSGDVGQGAFEEINKAASNASGLNYGWRCYEGNSTFNTSGCPPDSELFFPVAAYSHENNGPSKCSITGGYVYRGSQFSKMVGKYFFADFCSDEIGMLNADGSEDYAITYSGPFSGNALSSFGEDQKGELYVVGLGSGKLFQVVDADELGLVGSSAEKITVFPNPAKNTLSISGLDNRKQIFRLYGLTGQLIKENAVDASNNHVDISRISRGVYVAQLTGQDGSLLTFKVVAQ